MVNDQELEERVLEKKGFVVVFFFWPNQTSCNHFSPRYESVAAELGEHAAFLKLNVMENPTLTQDLRVDVVPTTVVYKDGCEAARFEGECSKDVLFRRLKDLFSSRKSR
jgi:thioredoxin 1